MDPSPQTPHAFYRDSSIARLWRLCLKELRENLRDRRTITTLVLMPLLLYPLLSIIFQRFLLTGEMARVAHQIVLGVPDEMTQQYVEQRLLLAEQILNATEESPHQAPVVGLKEFQLDQAPQVLFQQHPDLEQNVLAYQVDLGIRLQFPDREDTDDESNVDMREGRPVTWELIIQDGSMASERALQFVRRRLAVLNDALLRLQLQQLGDSGEPFVEARVQPIGERDDNNVVSLAMVIPLVLILMTMTGAVYPAIDSTAGERERGTLEAVIATPVPRFALLLAKYLAVVTVSVLTATANLAAMTITLHATGIARAVLGSEGFGWQVIVLVFALLLVFAIFFSAVVLAVTSFARSFKEAQAYLIPLILVSLGPSLICLAPGIRLGPILAVTPLMNLVLLAREIFEGSPPSGLWLVAILSSVLYAVAAVAIAARVFGSDAVLYGNDVTWKEVFRRPGRTTAHISSHAMILTLAVVMPLYILLTSLVSSVTSSRITWLLAGSTAVSIVLFGLTPLVIAWHQRLNLRSGLQWRWPSVTAWPAALLLGLSIWPILLWVTYQGGLTSSFADKYDAAQQLIDSFRRVPWPWVILLLAVIPAMVEELFFRGFVLSSLLADASPRKAILVSACLFGVFHVFGSSLAAERFLPSTMMGVILGWVCWKTGSIFPGMVLHAVHNGALVSLAYFQEELTQRGWLELTPLRIGVGLGVAAASAWLAWLLLRHPHPPQSATLLDELDPTT